MIMNGLMTIGHFSEKSVNFDQVYCKIIERERETPISMWKDFEKQRKYSNEICYWHDLLQVSFMRQLGGGVQGVHMS